MGKLHLLVHPTKAPEVRDVPIAEKESGDVDDYWMTPTVINHVKDADPTAGVVGQQTSQEFMKSLAKPEIVHTQIETRIDANIVAIVVDEPARLQSPTRERELPPSKKFKASPVQDTKPSEAKPPIAKLSETSISSAQCQLTHAGPVDLSRQDDNDDSPVEDMPEINIDDSVDGDSEA